MNITRLIALEKIQNNGRGVSCIRSIICYTPKKYEALATAIAQNKPIPVKELLRNQHYKYQASQLLAIGLMTYHLALGTQFVEIEILEQVH